MAWRIRSWLYSGPCDQKVNLGSLVCLKAQDYNKEPHPGELKEFISGHVNHSKDGTIFKMYHCADSSENHIGALTSVVIVNYQKSFSVIEIMLKQNINITFFFFKDDMKIWLLRFWVL